MQEKQRVKFWVVFVDGTSNAKGAGVGIVIFTIDEGMIEQSVGINFTATNNVAKYETIMLAL